MTLHHSQYWTNPWSFALWLNRRAWWGERNMHEVLIADAYKEPHYCPSLQWKAPIKKRYNVLTCLCERRTRRQQKMTFLFKKWTSSYEYGLVCDTMMSIMWCGDMLTAYVIIFSILFFVNISWRVRQGQLWKKGNSWERKKVMFWWGSIQKNFVFFLQESVPSKWHAKS